jgi:hypothetical protein
MRRHHSYTYCTVCTQSVSIIIKLITFLGCFAETTGPEMQLHWVIENAKIVRSLDGVTSLVVALKDALRRYDTAM